MQAALFLCKIKAMNAAKEHEFRNKIYWYSFLLSLLVVLIHSVNLAIDNQTLEAMILTRDHMGTVLPGVTGVAGHLEHFFSNAFGQMAVPGFFLMSGYLFFRTLHGFRDIGRKWRERVGSLLIPYGAWNVLWYLAYVLCGRRSFSLGGMSEAAADYSCNPTFWYMYQLILLTLLAPLLYLLLRQALGMLLALGLLALLILLNVPLPMVNADALLYYGVGALLAVHGRRFFEGSAGTAGLERRSAVFGGLLLLLAWLLQLLTPAKLNSYVVLGDSGIARMTKAAYYLSGGPLARMLGQELRNIPGVVKILSTAGAQALLATSRRLLMALGLWFLLPAGQLPEAQDYMKNSFFLYAVHYPIARAQYYMIQYLGIPYEGGGEAVRLALYFLSPVLAVGVSYGLKTVLQRYVPLEWRILSGGR